MPDDASVMVGADQLEASLAEHFRRLAEARSVVGTGDPVFALEHHLSATDCASLGTLLGKALGTRRRMSDTYWHMWVVHASEHGYSFDGQEYWDSFAARTPNWTIYGNRERLRGWFWRFAESYQGAEPSGAWAGHYAYICWPVTHALLPRDLQVQLARSMYEARYALADLASAAPDEIGRRIELVTNSPSSRYSHFLQQPDLVGRIVRALLIDDDPMRTRLYGPTVERIAADLNTRANAREWLRDTRRQVARDAFKLVAPTRQRSREPSNINIGGAGHSATRSPSTQPRIRLRQTGNKRWRPMLILPSLLSAANANPGLRRELEKCMVRLPFCGDGASPGSLLLMGRPVERSLLRWPEAGAPVVSFTPPTEGLSALAASMCVDAPQSRLFKRTNDGWAVEQRTHLVQAGGSYILVDQQAEISCLGLEAEVEIPGMKAVALEIPAHVPALLEARLEAAGLRLQRRVTLRPIGLWPRQWGDDGYGEWLTTETVCFALQRDHEFDAYRVCVDDEPEKEFVCPGGTPVFLRLDGLDVGPHSVTVATFSCEPCRGGTVKRTRATIALEIVIRPPSSWVPGSLCQQAMVVRVTPPTLTMEDLVANRIELHAEGDSARRAVCDLVLLDRDGVQTAVHRILEQQLPILHHDFTRAVQLFFDRYTNEFEFEVACSAYLAVESQDLGQYRVPLIQRTSPLRWALTGKRSTRRLRLVNECVESTALIWHYGFSQPLSARAVSLTDMGEVALSQDDGIYVARAADHEQAIVVSTTDTYGSLAALRAPIDVEALHTAREAATLVDAYRLWSVARPVDALSRSKQRQVAREIHRQLIRLICGERWLHSEERVERSPKQASWEQLEENVLPTGRVSYAIALSQAAQETHCSLEHLYQRFVSISRSFRVSKDQEELRVAWAFSQRPGQEIVNTVITSSFADLARGARLLVLRRAAVHEALTT